MSRLSRALRPALLAAVLFTWLSASSTGAVRAATPLWRIPVADGFVRSITTEQWVPPQRPRPVVAQVASAQAAQLRAALNAARSSAHTYGAQLAVCGGELGAWSGAAGVARDGHTPLTAADPFVIGSVTKTYITALVFQLVDEGRLQLDDPVSRYLPKEPMLAGITIRELLGHTSGLADLYYPLRDALLAQPSRSWTPAEVLHSVGAAWFRPGAGYAYSNTNFVVAGMLLEAVTGRPLGDLVQQRLADRYGLADTWLLAGDRADPALLEPSWATAFGASGAMRSTAADLCRWGEALYDGHVVRSADLALMTKANKEQYGLGTATFSFDGRRAIGHSGLLKTTTSLLVHFPDKDVTVALIVNRTEVDLGAMLTHRAPGAPSILDVVIGPPAHVAATS